MIIVKNAKTKNLSWPLKTTEISKFLNGDDLVITYSQYSGDINHLSAGILTYRHQPKANSYNYLNVHAIPAKVRIKVNDRLRNKILPYLKDWLNANALNRSNYEVSVYYEKFHRSNSPDLDRGGLYVVKDRYARWEGRKSKLLFRDKEFDIDQDLK